ncbi:MAG: hypothetical protein A2784_01345 [Candidatus Chisholmbacteria bacterium RIFCSPHIGHO2_01_FULL_48_12]|uniref:DUF86 domain-containing protein n=1 Tax=Candidatus Chisholmbacteria bacterium RIFCSPHIGHO2_01_FULL_48_12 TaxID=1797589 RepID=A0A1G1VLQ4_9BACT|nr:MAG: hypothetical protein A2784_01345 [Candidatus Chisholmbacteria bacterium RIFCSPHIGHO2_01_FULL_48_12]
MNKNILLYLNDILESIALVEQYVSGVKEEDFSRDKEKQDSVIRRLMIIGEAATRVPKEIRALSPDTQWRAIIGFRNVVIHEYAGVSMGRVWEIVEQELPPLKSQLTTLLSAVSSMAEGKGKSASGT